MLSTDPAAATRVAATTRRPGWPHPEGGIASVRERTHRLSGCRGFAATSPATAMTAGPHRDRSISPQNAAATGTSGIAIRYPVRVASPAGRSPPASRATMMPTWTSSKISRTPTAARRGTLIRRFRAVITSAYPVSARPATIIVVGTAPFTHDTLLRFVVTDAGSAVRASRAGAKPLALASVPWPRRPVIPPRLPKRRQAPRRPAPPRPWPGSPQEVPSAGGHGRPDRTVL